MIANPKTKKPFRSLYGSWEAARNKAGLPHIEIDELRHCSLEAWVGSQDLKGALDVDANEATSSGAALAA